MDCYQFRIIEIHVLLFLLLSSFYRKFINNGFLIILIKKNYKYSEIYEELICIKLII